MTLSARGETAPREPCFACGGLFPRLEGPTHAYMLSSPGCWAHYGRVLAREYAAPGLLPTHRLSVDAYAVQHPGRADERRAVQSTGLHLARLRIQLQEGPSPEDANDVMLGLGPAKASLPRLPPPAGYTLTVADVPLDGAAEDHVAAVRAWAAAAWEGWREHHAFIADWTRDTLAK